MAPDQDDPILDAFLEELLGGRSPPDLTASILQRWAQSPAFAEHAPAEGNGRPANDMPAWPVVQASPRVSKRCARATAQALTCGRAGWLWAGAALLAGVLIAATIVGIRRSVPPNLPAPIAEQRPSRAVPDAAHRASVTPQPAPADTAAQSPQVPLASDLPQALPAPLVRLPSSPDSPMATSPLVSPPAPDAAAVADRRGSPATEIVQFVNHRLEATWQEAGVRPAPPASDGEWCRRLFLRVLGRVPSPDELTAFTSDRRADKRQWLVEELLTQSAYVEEYAQHWATLWTNALIGRTGGQAGSLASRDDLERFLTEALAEQRPWDAVVIELLTATGSPRPGPEDYRPAVNFLLDGWDGKAILATSRVARVFLGTQLHCAQCHAHPTQELSQEQFWSLNAFFRQVKVDRTGGVTRLVEVDFLGEGKGSHDGEVYYETPNGLLKTAFPRFLDGQAIPPQGALAEVNRRRELARLVVTSDRFAQAMVNRVWAHFFGYGLTQPVDDIGPQVSTPHRELLTRLATEFAAHGFDLTQLIRWIALSDPFSRSSRLVDLASRDLPEAGEVPLFSRYYTRPLAAEEVYRALVHAAQLRKSSAGEAELSQARRDWLAQSQRRMGTDDAQEEQFGGVRQSLLMMNGDLVRRAVNSQQQGLLRSLIASELPFDKKVEHLFLAALSRPPSRRELRAAQELLATSHHSEPVALEDIWWALLNSSEFLLDH